MNQKPFININSYVNQHITYLENVRQDFHNKSEELISNFMVAKYIESKMIMFFCKINTIKWLENTLTLVIDINEWYEMYLSKYIDNLEKCQIKNFMEDISNNSLCGHMEKLFEKISELSIFLDASKEHFPPMINFSSTYVADLAWLFSRKIEELNYIDKKLQVIQNDVDNLERRIHEIIQKDKNTSFLYKK